MTAWFSATLETTILINAPPEKVREVCLDFDHLSEWHTDFIVSTTVTRPGTVSNNERIRGIEALPGDSLAILSGGFVGLARVQENGPGVFSYEYTGRELGLDATRAFYFSPGPSSVPEGTDSGRTLLRHFASWQGYAAIMFMAWSPIRWHVKRLFEGFHRDLKTEVEKKRD